MSRLSLLVVYLSIVVVCLSSSYVQSDSTDTEAECHPECRWQCDDPVCPAQCHPVCERPKCQMQCEETPCAQCTVHCEKPACNVRCPKDMCEKAACPKCETVCAPAECRTTCVPPEPVCTPMCEETRCDWKCRKPTLCPKPKCELVCEKAACLAHSHKKCCSCNEANLAASVQAANAAVPHALVETETPTFMEVMHTVKFHEKQGRPQCCLCADS